MVDDRNLPASLRTALLPLESVQGFEFLETWRWNEKAQRWTVKCRLTARNDAGEPFSDPTDWYVLVSEAYPFGEIDFMPAKQNGLTDTYQHQSYNHEGDPDLPWRRGKLCLNTAVRVLGRHGYDIEPYEPDERLRWHCLRAIDWLKAAYTDSLVLPGEPFEVPHIPCANSDTIVYREDRESFDRWSREEDIAGDVAAHEVKDSSGIFAIEAFHRLTGVLLPSAGCTLRHVERVPEWLLDTFTGRPCEAWQLQDVGNYVCVSQGMTRRPPEDIFEEIQRWQGAFPNPGLSHSRSRGRGPVPHALVRCPTARTLARR